ncbi:MAG: cytochrome c [Gemmatimonadaceae bacterium]
MRRPLTHALTRAALGAMLLIGVACAKRDGETVSTAGRSPGVPATFGDYDAGGAPGGPGAGTRYALGTPANASEIAAWNTDVGAEGAELPPGRGSVSEGAALYVSRCAACHGAGGRGGIAPNPALVGRDSTTANFEFADNPKLVKTVGNYWPYASTLFDYIKRAMPLATPGSLTDSEVYALTAYLLSENQIVPAGTTLDAAGLRAIRMPAADRFVPDDRSGGAVVR